MTTQEGIRIGSSKMNCRVGEPGQIDMVDRGYTSVLDRGPILDFDSDEVAVARTTQAEAIFRLLHHHGIATHFIKRVSDTALRVYESSVKGQLLLSGKATAQMVGLEVLCRVRASQKFSERFARGEIPPEKLAWPAGIELQSGTKFGSPPIEFSTKWQPGGDEYVSDDQAAKLVGGDTPLADLEAIIRFGERVALILDRFTRETGYTLYDFKIEVAKEYASGRIIMIDVLTLDEMLLVKHNRQYGKNHIRFYFQERHPGWVAKLKEAKLAMPESKLWWPEYPPLPNFVKKSHVSMYQEVAANWSGWVAKHCH